MATSHGALSIGPVARRLADRAAAGRVLAVFGPAFYLLTPEGVVCVGTRALDPGPLSVVTTAGAAVDWRATDLRPGAAATLSPAALRVGNELRVSLAGASRWSPGPALARIDPRDVRLGLGALREALPADPGLARFLRPGYLPAPRHHDCRAAAPALAGARLWLAGVLARAPAPGDLGWAARLIGLGPGLTPAGDDVLGGAMIALNALGQGAAARRLWQGIAERACRETNDISCALMRAASDGLGSDALHRALAAILAGDVAAVRAAMPRIARIGHSSGWDAITGAVIVLDAWLDAAPSGYPAANSSTVSRIASIVCAMSASSWASET